MRTGEGSGLDAEEVQSMISKVWGGGLSISKYQSGYSSLQPYPGLPRRVA